MRLDKIIMPIKAKIKLEVINDDLEYENWGSLNLGDPKDYQSLLLAFGNGVIEEARVVGETKGGVLMFASLLERGGYRRGDVSDIKNRKLYKDGDVCYPENSPFIFISPVAENGEIVNFDNYRNELENFVHSLGRTQSNDSSANSN